MKAGRSKCAYPVCAAGGGEPSSRREFLTQGAALTGTLLTAGCLPRPNQAVGTTSCLAVANSLVTQAGHAAAAELETRPIGAVRVGEPIIVPGNYGDTWSVAWADDGHLYASANDALNFDSLEFHATEAQVRLRESDYKRFLEPLTAEQKKRLEAQFRPIGFNRIEGDDPRALRGLTVNRMEDYGFDKGPKDDRAWKSSGVAFIDGALYWAIARHRYPEKDDVVGLRQQAAHCSILKSTDYGKTWIRSARDNGNAPMFPGSHFATPYFVDYGRSRPRIDGADRYVYAMSNNGFWDNGDTLILGRVLRSRIGALNGADWEFFIGGDGLVDASWTREVQAARPILENAGKLGETGAVYIPARQRYMMIGWYYPGGSGYYKGSSNTTVWDFYEAPTPWGPWARIGSHTWTPQGYYCPAVCPKFQSTDQVYVVTAGDFHNWWDHYHFTLVPLDLG